MEHEPPRLVRDWHGRFAKGGAGRPAGARNKVSRRVAQAILADFEANQDEVLPRLRQWFLPQYVSLIARLVSRHGEADQGEADAGRTSEDLDAEAAARLIEAARVAFARIDAGQGTLADLEAALAGDPILADSTDSIGDYR